jgi:diadenosine tetraphosphate (Ap4A) HIT family hydrolase
VSGDVVGCLACDTASGRVALPGGGIGERDGWLIEPCIGPLPAGTLILKPRRHLLSLADLDDREAAALGPQQRTLAAAVREVTGCDQVYCCLWSHAGWQPVHIHFVLQPAWNADREHFDGPGPTTQAAMFQRAEFPNEAEVAAAAARVREWLKAGGSDPAGV